MILLPIAAIPEAARAGLRLGGGRFRYLDGSRERGERDRRSPAADCCSRRRNDGAGIGVPHHRERRRLIPYAENAPGALFRGRRD